MAKPRILHLTTHVNIGGITSYIKLLTKEMNKLEYNFCVASAGGTQTEFLEREGVKCFKLNIRTKSEISPKVFLAIKPVIDIIKRERIDLIHAHTRVTQMLSWWVQRFTGIPYMSTCHGFYKRRLGRRLIPGWGNKVIAISRPVENSLIEDFRVPKKKATTIFNAIDIPDLVQKHAQKDSNAIRKELNIPEGIKVLGIVARVVEDKGHEYFLRAAKKVIDSGTKNIRVAIVGEGPFLAKTKKLVEELKMQDFVLFMGYIQDITYALAVIDIFVLPAIWREGFGLSIIEAMAVKKPVIVTNIWSLNELVENKETGLLVEPRDIPELAEAMKLLIEDEATSKRIGERGCEMVAREFDIPQMAGHVDKVYVDLVNAFSAKRSKSHA